MENIENIKYTEKNNIDNFKEDTLSLKNIKGATLAEVLVYASLFLLFAISLLYISISVNKVYRILITKNQSYILLNKYTNLLLTHLVSNPPLDDSTPPYTLDMSDPYRKSINPASSTKLILYDIDHQNTKIEPYQLSYKKKYLYFSSSTFNLPPYNDGKVIQEYENGPSRVVIDNIEAVYFLLLDINGNYIKLENNENFISGYSVMAVLYLNEKHKNDNKLISNYVIVSK